jgi:TRAP-type uncharacterized transport system substrate-binding protein
VHNNIKILFVTLAIAITLASVYLSFRLLNPTPPRQLTLATGPSGSAYERMGELYREILAESGVEVRLQASKGAIENLELLMEDKVDLGFVTMGSQDTEHSEELRSLGAMFFEPLWVFTRDPDLQWGRLDELRRSRISIGPVKSRSNAASRYLLNLNGIDPGGLQLFELEPSKAADQLQAGQLETQLIVGNAISPVIRRLLAAEEIMLVDFQRADAYVALFPELTKLIVPAGVGSLALNLPPQDTRVLAFTAILAVQKGMHPITQSLFLEAASRIHGDPDLFHGAAEFPQPRDQLILLSDSARAYFADGRPLLLRLLPYPVAVLVMQLIAATIPLLGVVYPMLRLMPSAFHWIMRHQFHRVYTELRLIDRGIGSASVADLKTHQERLEYLEQRVTGLRVPVTYATKIYALKAHIGSVLQRVRDALIRQSGFDKLTPLDEKN